MSGLADPPYGDEIWDDMPERRNDDPDTETLAEVRLTDAEREALAQAVVREFIDHPRHNPAHGLGVFDRSRCDRIVAPAVERILAARIEQARAGEGALREVAAERAAQDAKWGEQNHPDGTGSVWEFCSGQHDGWAQEAADDARRRCQEAWEKPWGNTYALILNEEVAEVFAEDDPARLRAELIQVAAVAVAWVEKLDRAALTAADPS